MRISEWEMRSADPFAFAGAVQVDTADEILNYDALRVIYSTLFSTHL